MTKNACGPLCDGLEIIGDELNTARSETLVTTAVREIWGHGPTQGMIALFFDLQLILQNISRVMLP